MSNAQPRLSDDQRLAWLRLIRTDRIGPMTFRDLLDRFGDAQEALDRVQMLARRGGATEPGKLCSRDEALREMEAVARIGARFVALVDDDYPSALRHAPAPPPLLCVKGAASALTKPMAALVGSRNASTIGRQFTGMIARGLGEAGFIVVSGLARGIDAAAHEASLETGTVASLAGGLDRIYPAEHAALVERIIQHGAVVSEMPLGWEPRAQDFPRRNRLIAGMALSVGIVEAAERSGALITARMAAEADREVFAVPGHPLDPRAAGVNRLLKQGAALLTSVEDMLEVLRPQLGKAVDIPGMQGSRDLFATAPLPKPDLAEGDLPENDRTRVLSALGAQAIEIDALIRDIGLPVAAVHLILLELELAGRLERQPGGRIALL